MYCQVAHIQYNSPIDSAQFSMLQVYRALQPPPKAFYSIFFKSKKKVHTHQQLLLIFSSFNPSGLGNHKSTFCLRDIPIQHRASKCVIQYMLSDAWLNSLSIMLSRFTHVAAYIFIYFVAILYSLVWICHIISVS